MRLTVFVLVSGLVLLPSGLYPAGVITTEEYTPTNIDGGWVKRVVEAPSSPGTFYAVSYGCFKSNDGGSTWTRLLAPAPTSAIPPPAWSRHCTNSVAVNPSDADNVVVADSGWSAIWVSNDGGASWGFVSFGGEKYENYKRAGIVSSSYYNSDYFFTCIENQEWSGETPTGQGKVSTLYMSKDKGYNWTALDLATTRMQSFADVAQMPSGRIVAAVIDVYMDFNRDNADSPATGSLYYSDDSGATFTQVSGFTAPAYSITWDAHNSLLWLITSQGEIYKSSNGSSWGSAVFTVPNTTSACHRPAGIKYAGGATPYILAFTNNNSNMNTCVYRSTNAAGGFPADSWLQMSLPGYNDLGNEVITGVYEDIVIDSRNTDGSHWGVATNSGAFFYTTTASLTTTTVSAVTQQTSICTNPIFYGIKDAATNRMLALSDTGLYLSPNNGATWSRVSHKKGVVNPSGYYLALDPSSASKIYMITKTNILYTVDNGADYFANPLYNFTADLNTVNAELTNLVISPVDGTMYIGFATKGTDAPSGNYLYRSADSGVSWTAVTGLTSHGIYNLALEPGNPQVIYAGCGNEQSEGGSSIFGGTADGLFRTEDGGATWTSLGFEGRRVAHIMIDQYNPNAIIAGFDQAGYYCRTAISSDRGASWRNIKWYQGEDSHEMSDLQDINTRCTFIINGILYAGNAEGSIMRGTNYGLTPMEKILTMPNDVRWIFEGSLYAATAAGLYALNLSNIDIVKPYAGDKIKMYNFPNPFNPKKDGGTVIRVCFPNSVGQLKLKIYNVAAELVADTIYDNVTGDYAYAFIWDGRNDEGGLCGPGLYIAVADADGTQVRHKIVLVR